MGLGVPCLVSLRQTTYRLPPQDQARRQDGPAAIVKATEVDRPTFPSTTLYLEVVEVGQVDLLGPSRWKGTRPQVTAARRNPIVPFPPYYLVSVTAVGPSCLQGERRSTTYGHLYLVDLGDQKRHGGRSQGQTRGRWLGWSRFNTIINKYMLIENYKYKRRKDSQVFLQDRTNMNYMK